MGRQALDAPRKQYFLLDPNVDLIIIGLDTKDGEEHALYDPRIKLPIDKNLVKNIAAIGVKKPVLVRKNGDLIEVVDGRQRVRAAREANLTLEVEGKEPVRVPCIIERGDDHDLFGILISTNEHVQGDTPLGKAEKLRRYMAMGRSEDEASVMFGVSLSTIRNWLVLLDLTADVKKAVERGELSASAASKLAGLSAEEQKAKLGELIEEAKASGTRVTGTRTRAAAAAASGSDVVIAPSKRELKKLLAQDPDVVAEVLSPDFVMAVRWVVGDLPAGKVKGLTKLLRAADEPKAVEAKEEPPEKPKKGPRKPAKKRKKGAE